MTPNTETEARLDRDRTHYRDTPVSHGWRHPETGQVFSISDLPKESIVSKKPDIAENLVWLASGPSFDTDDARREMLRAASLIGDLLKSLQESDAFIGAMFGRGEDAVVPETVMLPLGVPCKLGDIVRDMQAAIRKAEAA